MSDNPTDIQAFVRARLWEAQQAAEKCPPFPWQPNAEHDEVHTTLGEPVCEGFALSSHQIRSTVDFIVSNDPSQILRDIHLKRDILDLWIEAGKSKDFSSQSWVLLREIVYAIAALYSDHPDYNPKWKPIFGVARVEGQHP